MLRLFKVEDAGSFVSQEREPVMYGSCLVKLEGEGQSATVYGERVWVGSCKMRVHDKRRAVSEQLGER